MSSQSSRKTSRLSARIDSDLKAWIEWYAERTGTTVTNLITSHFEQLRKNYRNRNKVEVEQL